MAATLQDLARIETAGYKVHKLGAGTFVLTHESDPSPYSGGLIVGGRYIVSPTQWECVAEALTRIEQDARFAS